MDRETAEHFYKWLAAYVADDEQHTVEQQVHAALREYPGLPENRSWPEIRRIGEGICNGGYCVT